MSRLFLIYLGSLVLRSTGIALIAGICTWKMRNVAARHAAWVVVLAAMLMMPVFDALLPAAWVPARVQQIAEKQNVVFPVVSPNTLIFRESLVRPTSASAAPAVKTSPMDWWRVTAALYVAIAAMMFIRLLMGYRTTGKLKRSGKTVTSAVWEEFAASHRLWRRIPVLLESEAVQVPMTIGLFRPAVILPVSWHNWDDWKLRAVLLHEMTHVRRCDWGIAVIAAVAKCAYWLNPLSWFLDRKLSELAEHASDDASILCTENATRYAEMLLEFAAAAQNGGRFMKRGVAMAHYKIQSRIERVLRNPKPGSDSLKIAGWILVLTVAAPVIYSASALQVASGRTPIPPISPYKSAAFSPAPQTQVPAVSQQSRRPSTPAVSQTEPGVSGQTAEIQNLLELQLQRQNTQRAYDSMRRKLLEAQLQQSLERAGQRPERINGTTEFLTRETAVLAGELERLQNRIQEVQSQTAAQPQGNPPNSPSSAQSLLDLPDPLLDLPDNAADLRAYLEELARRRRSQSSTFFTVSFTGFQGRIVSMKVGGQDFSLGCDGCSFFVGDSVVSSAVSIPPGPGMQLRLSPEGTDLSLTCRAPLCEVHIESEDGSSTQTRPIPTGATESIRTSKKISVVITKN